MTVNFRIGESFADFASLEAKIEKIQKQDSVQFWKRDSRSIKAAKSRAPNKNFNELLKYSEVTYYCIHGGKTFKASGGGKKATRIKSQSLHSAHMFIGDILMQVTHEQRQTQQHVVEGFFIMMISHFGSMCNLEPRAPFYKHIVNIKGNYVTAIPDVRFTYASTDETDGLVLTVSVVEVKKSSRKTGHKVKKVVSPGSSDSSCSEDEMTVFDIHNFVGEDVLGQHGIQLLAESFYSAKHNKQAQASHVFGMIMLGVQVIFTCLQISDQEVKSINAFGKTDAPRRGIKYSKPLNILSFSDRRQVYEILFRLSEEIDLTQTVNQTS